MRSAPADSAGPEDQRRPSTIELARLVRSASSPKATAHHAPVPKSTASRRGRATEGLILAPEDATTQVRATRRRGCPSAETRGRIRHVVHPRAAAATSTQRLVATSRLRTPSDSSREKAVVECRWQSVRWSTRRTRNGRFGDPLDPLEYVDATRIGLRFAPARSGPS